MVVGRVAVEGFEGCFLGGEGGIVGAWRVVISVSHLGWSVVVSAVEIYVTHLGGEEEGLIWCELGFLMLSVTGSEWRGRGEM